MITSITLQTPPINKNYSAHKQVGIYGEKDITDLLADILRNINHLQNIENIIRKLNADLTANAAEVLSDMGYKPTVINKTKTKRTVSIANLTIHEVF